MFEVATRKCYLVKKFHLEGTETNAFRVYLLHAPCAPGMTSAGA